MSNIGGTEDSALYINKICGYHAEFLIEQINTENCTNYLKIIKRFKVQINWREDIKYYFADFVCKGGTLPPFKDKKFAQKKVTD